MPRLDLGKVVEEWGVSSTAGGEKGRSGEGRGGSDRHDGMWVENECKCTDLR